MGIVSVKHHSSIRKEMKPGVSSAGSSIWLQGLQSVLGILFCSEPGRSTAGNSCLWYGLNCRMALQYTSGQNDHRLCGNVQYLCRKLMIAGHRLGRSVLQNHVFMTFLWWQSKSTLHFVVGLQITTSTREVKIQLWFVFKGGLKESVI